MYASCARLLYTVIQNKLPNIRFLFETLMRILRSGKYNLLVIRIRRDYTPPYTPTTLVCIHLFVASWNWKKKNSPWYLVSSSTRYSFHHEMGHVISYVIHLTMKSDNITYILFIPPWNGKLYLTIFISSWNRTISHMHYSSRNQNATRYVKHHSLHHKSLQVTISIIDFVTHWNILYRTLHQEIEQARTNVIHSAMKSDKPARMCFHHRFVPVSEGVTLYYQYHYPLH